MSATFKRKITNFIDPKDKVILLLGHTGTWKSSFVNAVGEGDTAPVGHSMTPCTDTITAFRITSSDSDPHPIVLIDTPGFGAKENPVIFGQVTEWLTKRNIHVVSAILFFHKITDDRITNEDMKAWELFKSFVGEPTMKTHVTVLTTDWGNYKDHENLYHIRETDLKDQFMKGCQYKRLNCPCLQSPPELQTLTASDIVQAIAQNAPSMLLVLKQMAGGKAYLDTDVGAAGKRDEQNQRKSDKGIRGIVNR